LVIPSCDPAWYSRAIPVPSERIAVVNPDDLTDGQLAALAGVNRRTHEIEYHVDVAWIEVAPGIELPEKFLYRESPRGGELLATLHMRVVDGHAVCERIDLEPSTAPTGQHTPLTRAAIRDLPFGRLVDNARMEAARVTKRQPPPEDADPAYWERQRRVEALLARQRGEEDPVRAATRPLRAKREAIPMDNRRLEEVAVVYNAAAELGKHPTAEVMADPRWAPVSRTTASRWVRRARDRGLIPEARKDA
jgi:hypothetical protein